MQTTKKLYRPLFKKGFLVGWKILLKTLDGSYRFIGFEWDIKSINACVNYRGK